MSDIQIKSRTAESVSGKVLNTVAARKDTEPTALQPPLYEVVDPDALDNLFTPRADGSVRMRGEVRFAYCGYEIRISSNGDVRAVPEEE